MSSFRRLMKDKVTLIKQAGQEYPDVSASVQKNQIFIMDSNLPIEEGDRFTRTLSNGLQESYLILDRGFRERVGGIRAHYQCEVQKESSMPYKQQQSTSITYNLHGANPRVNVNSTDSSVNILNGNVFDELKAAIKSSNVPEQEQEKLVEAVECLEAAKETPSFMSKYKDFIEVAANHISVVSPFLPAITKFLL